jgi:DNA-binding MarR family transcriptional regulator
MKHRARIPENDTGHLQVLKALDGAGHISQRSLADALGMAASRVNRIIRSLVDGAHVEVTDEGLRPFAYKLTKTGQAYLQELSYDHYATAVGRFREVQERIATRLTQIKEQGVERVVLYGAGEVMEVTYPLACNIGLEVVGVVDDDPGKQGDADLFKVAAPNQIIRLAPDAVVITTFRHADQIRTRSRPNIPPGLKVLEL